MKFSRRFTRAGAGPYQGIDFGSRRSEIRNPDGTLVWAEKADGIEIEISDNGKGIKKENITNIFDPFYSTKPSPLERKGDEPTGTGLGLSTVYNLLKPYDVEIKIDSKIENGTEVMLKIPIDTPAK